MAKNMRRVREPDRSGRDARREAILELLGRGPIPSQASLRSLLAKRGIAVDQGTLSRDLAALGAVKGRGGYRLPRQPLAVPPDPGARWVQAAGQYLERISPAQNLLVLHTPPGGAAPLAAALDGVDEKDVVGTIAGDDTVLVITPTPTAAKRLARRMRELIR